MAVVARRVDGETTDGAADGPPGRRARRVPVLVAAAVTAAAATVWAVAAAPDGEPAAGEGLFSTPTGVVLLTSDGIDGVTAIDLDRRTAGRRVVDGERAGDQPFRLVLTGEHLVVGWGEIHAAPLSGGPSAKIADATLLVPAAEPGEVWTVGWEGGRVGQGQALVGRVRVDGTVTVPPAPFGDGPVDPVLGVPGGLVVRTASGPAIWDPDTGVGPVLGPGPVGAATSDGRRLAWCGGTCAAVHVVSLEKTGAPTAPHATGGPVAFSPDGRHLALLRPAGDGAELVVTVDGSERVVAGGLDGSGSLAWSGDGRQLFYVERSYGRDDARIGRLVVADGSWEIRTASVGGGMGVVATTPDEARSFLSGSLVEPDRCPPPAGFPSGRDGACTFGF